MKIVAGQVLSDLGVSRVLCRLGTTRNETPIYTNSGLGLCIQTENLISNCTYIGFTLNQILVVFDSISRKAM